MRRILSGFFVESVLATTWFGGERKETYRPSTKVKVFTARWFARVLAPCGQMLCTALLSQTFSH